MGVYIVINFIKMVNFGDDKINTEKYMLDLETYHELSYRNASFILMHTIIKQMSGNPVYFNDSEVQRYVEVDFKQRNYDWYKFKPGNFDYM